MVVSPKNQRLFEYAVWLMPLPEEDLLQSRSSIGTAAMQRTSSTS